MESRATVRLSKYIIGPVPTDSRWLSQCASPNGGTRHTQTPLDHADQDYIHSCYLSPDHSWMASTCFTRCYLYWKNSPNVPSDHTSSDQQQSGFGTTTATRLAWLEATMRNVFGNVTNLTRHAAGLRVADDVFLTSLFSERDVQSRLSRRFNVSLPRI